MSDAKPVSKSLFLKHVRIAFAEGVRTAKEYKGDGKPRFNCKFLIEKGSDNDKLILDRIKTVAAEEFGKNWEEILKSLDGRAQTFCYVSGNLFPEYDGFAGKMALSAVRYPKNGPPLVLDRDGRTPLDVSSGRPYSGCVVTAKVQIWAQNNDYGKGIRCTLEAVQFVKDADAFGGSAPASADGFEEEVEEESALLS